MTYRCSACGWSGTDPCWTERNGDPEWCDDGRMREPIYHAPVCRACFKTVTRITPVSGTVYDT